MWKWLDIRYLAIISTYSRDSKILELGYGRWFILG